MDPVNKFMFLRHSLQETADLPGAKKNLPGAFYRAPGKEILCRVPGLETPGKERPPANQPLPSAGHPTNSSRSNLLETQTSPLVITCGFRQPTSQLARNFLNF
jgi:hypothetical protein